MTRLAFVWLHWKYWRVPGDDTGNVCKQLSFVVSYDFCPKMNASRNVTGKILLVFAQTVRNVYFQASFHTFLKSDIHQEALRGCIIFGHITWHEGSLFPDRGWHLCPLQWKRGALTTGPPEKSWGCIWMYVYGGVLYIIQKHRSWVLAASRDSFRQFCDPKGDENNGCKVCGLRKSGGAAWCF